MKILKKVTVFCMVMMYVATSLLVARESKISKVSNISASRYVESSGTFDGNRIYADVTNNGLFLDYHVSGDSALEWPKGTGAHSIFQSALWLGAKVWIDDKDNDNMMDDDEMDIRVIIGDYTQDMGPGPWGGDPLSAVHRIYKVDKRMLASPLDYDDFQQWPTDFGAPWVDVDGDGVYTPKPAGPDHPEFIGDQVLWFVSNDGDQAYKLNMKTSPMDVEIQTTMFGFDRPDVFGDMVFLKQLVINKGSDDLIDTYMGLWSDPDLGYAGDDFVGCDVELGMGYVWNDGEDSTYSVLDTGTPAAGYDFLQGPMVPCEEGEDCSEGAKMFGTRHPGMKNLKMSSFAFYINGDDVYADPDDKNEGYNYLQGLRSDGTPFPNDIAGDLYDQKFCFYGDPNDPAGHSSANPLDGNYVTSSDRRFLMSVGPFTMAAGDSQEVVFGIFHAAGGDPLKSVSYLREVDSLAQLAYDIDFALPNSPPAPQVTVTALDNTIILEWDTIAEDFTVTSEVDFDPDGNNAVFEFEGYNIYQYETAQGAGESKRLATYDKVNGITEIYDNVFSPEYGETIYVKTQHGSDSGLTRYLTITKDGLNANSQLITNRNYYFAVTAYAYSPHGIPKTLESNPVYISVRPEVPNTFSMSDSAPKSEESFAITHVGPSGGTVDAMVVNPTVLTGDEYAITFKDELDGIDITTWTLTNTTKGKVLVEDSPIIGGVNVATGLPVDPGVTPIIDGMLITVNGPTPGLITNIEEYTAGFKEKNELRDNAVSYLPSASLGTTGYLVESRAGGVNLGGYARDFDRFEYWMADDIEFDFSHPSLAWNYASNNVESYVPFTMYRHNFDTGNKESLFAAYFDDDGDDAWAITYETCTGTDEETGEEYEYTCPFWSGPRYGAPSYDPVYGYAAFDTNGDGVVDYYNTSDTDEDGVYDNDAQYIVENNAFDSGGCGWGAWSPVANPDHYTEEYGCPGAYLNDGSYIEYPYLTATMFTDYLGLGLPTAEGIAANAEARDYKWTGASSVVFKTSKPLSSRDIFSFSTEGLVVLNDYDADRISVWPNPYYGYNPEERDALDRKVMFSHLPTEGPATIRIFALDGTLVRTIHHNDTGSQHAAWDMKNNFELPVASGMYIAHVETNHGEKVLKLAVIQPEQRLDVY